MPPTCLSVSHLLLPRVLIKPYVRSFPTSAFPIVGSLHHSCIPGLESSALSSIMESTSCLAHLPGGAPASASTWRQDAVLKITPPSPQLRSGLACRPLPPMLKPVSGSPSPPKRLPSPPLPFTYKLLSYSKKKDLDSFKPRGPVWIR